MGSSPEPDSVQGYCNELGRLGALLDHLRTVVNALDALKARVTEAEPGDGIVDSEIHGEAAPRAPTCSRWQWNQRDRRTRGRGWRQRRCGVGPVGAQ